MSENEIKPVDGAIPAREFDGQLWIPADVAIELRSNDRATIDLLREDLAEIRSQRDRAELLVEARGACIARLTAERDDALAAVSSKAGWEWKKRAEQAEAERDAAVAEMQAIRKAVGNEMLARFIDKHGDPVPLVVQLEAYKADAERYRKIEALAAGTPEQWQAIEDAAFASHWGNIQNFRLNIDAIDAARSEGGV